MKNYKIIARNATHTLVKGPFNYYLYIPNEDFKEDDTLLGNYWSCGVYVVDVDHILSELMNQQES